MASYAEMIAIRAPMFLMGLMIAVGFATPTRAAERAQGVLEIQIKDHREAIDDFAKLVLIIEKFSISPKPGLKFWHTGWKDLMVNPEPVDLTKHIGKPAARIFRASIDAGSFEAFHLKIKKIAGMLKKKQRSVPTKNTIGPVKLSFDVRPRGETLLIVDLAVTDMSDQPPRGYELSIKGLELFSDGKLIEKIPPG